MSTITKAGLKWLPNTYHNYHSYLQYFKPDHPVFARLATEQPIVASEQIESAKLRIKQCQLGHRQFLHLGDCAQSFEDSHQHITIKKAHFFRQCQNILARRKSKPVTVFGRVAGQFAKPRSQEFVIKDGRKMHNYKGDNVNTFDESDRDPSTQKLYDGYLKSHQIANTLSKHNPTLFYSHQGLILPYQQSLTRLQNDKFYCQSSHMIWIGERTRQLDGAHVQFFRGIQNPIGVKISNKISTEDFYQLVTCLNPQNQNGKLLVIVRMGKNAIESKLQELINIKIKQRLNFLFVTDPMHGNTYQLENKEGFKTRNIADILTQIRYFQKKMIENRLPYGYSFEATNQQVTQCHGLAYPFHENQLDANKFTSKCDPRLNNSQTKQLLSILNE